MDQERLHHTWLDSDRLIPRRFVRPALRFTHIESAGGVVLLLAAVAAVVWANAPFGESYASFWNTQINFEIGSFHLEETLGLMVNDGLMTIFFFVVGLEIKRELAVGELSDAKTAALPAIAALGGMVVPALIYVGFVAGTGGEATQGWGIPMATDIAFSVGVISLLGTRVPVGAKLFLLTLAFADDIGAIAVIAVFYTEDLSLGWLLLAIGGLAVVAVSNRVGIRAMPFYAAVGAAVWFFTFESGVHATLAGVALGLLTPAGSLYSDAEYTQRGAWILGRYEMLLTSPRGRQQIDADALQLASIATESVSPLDRLERKLHPWSSFLVIPIFALANAGVRFADLDFGEAALHPVSLGVGIGLFAGKAAGISAATWLALRFKIGRLPRRTNWNHVIGLAFLAGIGFTVSLFITELAFVDEFLTDSAKIGIFAGSILSGVVGYTVLRRGTASAASADE